MRVDPALFAPRADFLLRVRGLSMKDAGILDGDLLAVHKSAEARSGQIVVARLGDEVTVKRLKRDGAGRCCSSPRTPTSRRSSSTASARRWRSKASASA